MTMNLAEIYKWVDNDLDSKSGSNMGFEALLSTQPYKISQENLDGFKQRYEAIVEFQNSTINLFKKSLNGQAPSFVADMLLSDVPAQYRHEYCRKLTDKQLTRPVFFRTDEPVMGKLSEVQCPGSGWCIAELIYSAYQQFPETFGVERYGFGSLAKSLVSGVEAKVGGSAVIHHLTENASRAHGMRYLIQQSRQYGAKYFTYDRGVSAADCNFFRAHDSFNVATQNFFSERMQAVNSENKFFDLPPVSIFDGKLIMAFPFWDETKSFYSDTVRDLFPFTTVISKDGFRLEDGGWISLEDFAALPASHRDYYIKYAGTDVSINWGSKSVFLASGASKKQLQKFFQTIVDDERNGRYWVMQKAYRAKESVEVLNRDGSTEEIEGYSKWSGFYGPNGFMGMLVMNKNFSKVHGSENTVMSIVY